MGKSLLIGNILFVACVLFFAVGFLFHLIVHFVGRRIITHREEWLQIFSYYEWKTASEIKDGMKRMKMFGYLGIVGMTAWVDILDLEEERLIESRMREWSIRNLSIPKKEYRLTPVGSRKVYGEKEATNTQKNTERK